jgi:hypothetical protein
MIGGSAYRTQSSSESKAPSVLLVEPHFRHQLNTGEALLTRGESSPTPRESCSKGKAGVYSCVTRGWTFRMNSKECGTFGAALT